MKLITFLFIFFSYISFAQRVEVAAQGGYSFADRIASSDGRRVHGASFQASAGYYVTRHILVSCYYEANSWLSNYGPYPGYSSAIGSQAGSNHSFGIAPTLAGRHFFAGINLGVITFKSFYNDYFPSRFNSVYIPSLGYGAFAGARQPVGRRFSVFGRVDYTHVAVKGTVDYYFSGGHCPSCSTGTVTYNTSFPVTVRTAIVSLRVGMLYDLDFPIQHAQTAAIAPAQ